MRPAGKVAPSPKPRRPRAMQRPTKPSMRPWLPEASDQSRTAERGEPKAGRSIQEAPDGIGDHVAEAEDEDGVAVLRGGEMECGKDGGTEDGEDAAVDIAENDEKKHRDSKVPIGAVRIGVNVGCRLIVSVRQKGAVAGMLPHWISAARVAA